MRASSRKGSSGGTHGDFARAVNEGRIPGPRIFPSGAVVSQTSGHGDFRGRLRTGYVCNSSDFGGAGTALNHQKQYGDSTGAEGVSSVHAAQRGRQQ